MLWFHIYVLMQVRRAGSDEDTVASTKNIAQRKISSYRRIAYFSKKNVDICSRFDVKYHPVMPCSVQSALFNF